VSFGLPSGTALAVANFLMRSVQSTCWKEGNKDSRRDNTHSCWVYWPREAQNIKFQVDEKKK